MEKIVKIGSCDNSGFQVLPELRPSQQWLAQDRVESPELDLQPTAIILGLRRRERAAGTHKPPRAASETGRRAQPKSERAGPPQRETRELKPETSEKRAPGSVASHVDVFPVS